MRRRPRLPKTRSTPSGFAALFTAAAIFRCTIPALARGGGGGHAGGGGHSGGGHSGGSWHGGYGGGYGTSSGGGPMILPWPVHNAFDVFAIVLLVLLVLLVIGLLIYWSRSFARGSVDPDEISLYPQTQTQMRPFEPGAETPTSASPATLRATDLPSLAGNQQQVAAALTAFRASDPNFDPEAFLQKAQMTYFLVKKSWTDRKPDEARGALSPHMYEWLQSLTQQDLANHRIPVLANLNVRGMSVPNAERTAGSDLVDVHYDVVAASGFLDDRTGARTWGSGEDQRFGELWRFERKAGATTVRSGGVVAQKCPNCGAPLELSETGECKHCGAPIQSGAFDWVVTDMQNAPYLGAMVQNAFEAPSVSPMEGFAQIKAADPAFDGQAFMARAQTAFYALQKAWMDRNLDEGRAYMSPGLYLSWASQVQGLIDAHKRNVLEGMTVNLITPVKVRHGTIYDDITVRIEATCADYEVDETTNAIVFGDRIPRPFVEYWTFMRSIDAKTTGKPGIAEHTCPNCGAPLDVNAVGECRYCKAAVMSGTFDWVLSRIEQEEEYEG